ncbi:MAG: glycerol-3-phosphate 1-O-acyltransferase PlsY [Chthoniobacterales bacterium]|nr:glycerol-3-phosphate 1-O-acyltransferase PlsY [Chthoniobacterales bacterium]
MNQFFCYAAAGFLGYLLGSCPNGLLISRACGVDIRQRGSGNIGATNVLRVLGKRWGYLVFFLDALKGFIAVRVAFGLAVMAPLLTRHEIVGIIGGLACILGHTFPIWLRFRGGKGVATSAGVLLGLMPIAVLSVFMIWLLLFQISRFVSVASIVAAAALPLFVALYLHLDIITGPALLPFSILIAGVVIWRHRSNMRRLLHGTEERFGAR